MTIPNLTDVKKYHKNTNVWQSLATMTMKNPKDKVIPWLACCPKQPLLKHVGAEALAVQLQITYPKVVATPWPLNQTSWTTPSVW